mmetsp:Transcript_11938/g.51227  ORF Transcript_11938/g.51227 Transcript_11938/m.51227 type:complete len:259 (+) Transcript_11938:571-1347(+)
MTNASPPSSKRAARSWVTNTSRPVSLDEKGDWRSLRLTPFTVTAPARAHGTSNQAARAFSSSAAAKPGGRTAAVLRASDCFSSDVVRGGTSHLCSAEETPPFSSSAVGAARPSNAHANGGRFPPSPGASRAPPKCLPVIKIGKPTGDPRLFGARVALGGSAKFTMACSPNVTSAQSLPALSESPTPAKPLRLKARDSEVISHVATSPAPPRNVNACVARASKRHSACPSGSEQRWHEEPPGAKLRPCTASTAGWPEMA